MLVHQRVTKHPCFCGVHHFGAFTSNNSDSASQLFNTATHHCGGFTIVKKPRFKKIGAEPDEISKQLWIRRIDGDI